MRIIRFLRAMLFGCHAFFKGREFASTDSPVATVSYSGGFCLKPVTFSGLACGLGMTALATPACASIDPRHWLQTQQPLLLWGAAFIALLVLYAGWWWLQRGRQTPEHAPPSPSGLRGLSLGALIVLTALAIPLLDVARHQDDRNAALVVDCTASQWKWRFDYRSFQQQTITGVSFVSAMQTPPATDTEALAAQLFSAQAAASTADELLEVDAPLILPVSQRVRFAITSEDSVHAWWIPGLQVKKEAIPGFVQTVDVTLPDQPGLYRGMCSQLCGQQHAFMPIVVKLVSADAFNHWLTEAPARLAARQQRPVAAQMEDSALLTLGREVYRARCALCHQQDGAGRLTRFPALAGNPLVSGPPHPLLQLITEGRNVMPGMKGILARDEVAALVTFVRSEWGKMPVAEAIVQPADLQEPF